MWRSELAASSTPRKICSEVFECTEKISTISLLCWLARVISRAKERPVCTSITDHSFLGWLFADFFFDFASPVAREPGPEKSVEQVAQEKDRRHPFIIHHGEDKDDADNKKPWNRFLRLPIHCLEARILELAKHHEGEKEQQRRK